MSAHRPTRHKSLRLTSNHSKQPQDDTIPPIPRMQTPSQKENEEVHSSGTALKLLQ